MLPFQSFKAHNDSILCSQWTTTNLIATGSIDNSIHIFNPSDTSATGKQCSFNDNNSSVVQLSSTSNGKILCSTSLDGVVRIYDLQSLSFLSEIKLGAMKAYSICFDSSTGSSLLAVGGAFSTIRLFDINQATAISKIIAGGSNGTIYIFDTPNLKLLQSLSLSYSPIRALSCSPKAVYCNSGSNIVQAVIDENSTTVLLGHSSLITKLELSRGLLGSVSMDRRAKIWDLASLAVAKGAIDNSELMTISFNGDGRMVMTGSASGIISLYENDIIQL